MKQKVEKLAKNENILMKMSRVCGDRTLRCHRAHRSRASPIWCSSWTL